MNWPGCNTVQPNLLLRLVREAEIDTMKRGIVCILLFCVVWPCFSQRLDPEGLRDRLGELVGRIDARVGVAVISGGGDTLTVRGEEHFPLLSVFKFHQALAVCDRLRQSGQSLDMLIEVAGDELERDTWSPLRDEFPAGGQFSVRQLLDYTLLYSDNNACDILFARICGIARTSQYIGSLGISDFCIECNEKMMHEDIMNSYRNRTTPLSAALLLEAFHAMRDNNEYFRYVWDTMASCRTGTGRIPKYAVPSDAVIAHKTGTGDVRKDGRIIAVNDIGVILFPDGGHISLAVFVSDAACGMTQCEETIALIAEAVLESCAPDR